MNKQEAIEKIKNIDTLNINDINAGQSVDMVIKNQVLALINLKGWYRKYTDQKIADLTAGIEKQKSRLEQVESLEVENDTD